MTIEKYFSTIKQAEAYLNKLYSEFDYVKLTSFPAFSEEGYYTFSVK